MTALPRSTAAVAARIRPPGTRAPQQAAADEAPDAPGSAAGSSQPGGHPTGWDELVAAVLVGTERRQPPDNVFGGLLPFDAADAAEIRVLTAAAVLGPYRIAGRRAAAVPETPGPGAAPETLPPAGGSTLNVLDLLLSGQVGGAARNDLLAEWLQRCAQAARRVPGSALPRLLDHATANAELQPHAVPVLGTTGCWLAAQNPAWDWVAALAAVGDAHQAADVWRHGTTPRRRDVLRLLREHDPEAGLALLQSTWRSESAADRAAFVGDLVPTLTPADEPFLDACLDDRSQHVRRAAVLSLQRLPGSRFGERMAERAVPLVSVRGRQKPRLVVRLPAEPDDETRRDLVLEGRSQEGSRTRELLAMLAGTRLPVWEEHFGIGPDELIRRAREEHVLIDGWRRAAIEQRNVAWARALLAVATSRELMLVLPPAELAQRLATDCRDEAVPDQVIADLLPELATPWPDEVTQAVLERARRRARELRKPGVGRRAAEGLTSILRPAVRGMAPGAAPLVESWLRETGVTLSAARDLLHALMLRQTIEEFG